MAPFPHLKLPFRVEGAHKFVRFGRKRKPNERTILNRENRSEHGNNLKRSLETIRDTWSVLFKRKREEGWPLPNEIAIPVFLQLDSKEYADIDSLENWGVEVLSEEEDGYIVGVSSLDGLAVFEANVNQFLKKEGRYKNTAAKIWDLHSDALWRKDHLLKGDLKKIWEDLNEDKIYVVEIGVSCGVPNRAKYPVPQDYETEDDYIQAVKEFQRHEEELWRIRDEREIQRETEIEEYVTLYGGETIEIWDNQTDAKYFKLSLPGKGLRDIVMTYQYLFEVNLPTDYAISTSRISLELPDDLQIEGPDENAPKVCVIDSGIQEGHKLLAQAIIPEDSKSYVDGETSTADYVKQSGHGTKVAGAILYPSSIPKTGNYKLTTKIQNARILDSKNRISEKKFEPDLLQQIVSDYKPTGTRIFNLSVTEKKHFIGTHMSPMAAAIDKLSHEHDVLFIISSGNIVQSTGDKDMPGFGDVLAQGSNYPEYLSSEFAKVANPAISSFALTVGSVGLNDFETEDYKALAGLNKISPFSRVGLGLWGSIKPDVVEYGGDLVKNKRSGDILPHEAVSCELVNSTMYNSSSYGKSDFGTSFSAPKVSSIAAAIMSTLPNESSQIYRALIVQSARLPDHCFFNPTDKDIQHYGYGITNINHAIENSRNRITFIRDGNISAKKADIYRINVPKELRGQKEFQILVEVTLTFTAKCKSTRKGSHSYLSTWLEWKSSNYNEPFESFRNKTINYLDITDQDSDEELVFDEGDSPIQWTLRENVAWGKIKGVSRNNSTAQKDWTIIQTHQFAETFNLAVIGHAGWDKNLSHSVPYALCVSFEILGSDLDIYNLLAKAQVQIEAEQSQEIEI